MDKWNGMGNLLDSDQDPRSCSIADLDKVDPPQTKGWSAYEFLLEGFNSSGIFMYAYLRLVEASRDAIVWFWEENADRSY